MFESMNPSASEDNLLAEAAHSFVYSSLQQPVTGALQLVDQIGGTHLADRAVFVDRPEEAHTKLGWAAQQVGGALGMALDFYAGKRLLDAGLGRMATAETVDIGAASMIKRSAVTGAIYGGVFQPIDKGSKSNFWLNRAGNAATSGLTFAALSGTSLGLKGLAADAGGTFAKIASKDVVAGLAGSIPAGLISAEGSSLSAGQGLASKEALGKSMASFAVAGLTLGAAHTFKTSTDSVAQEAPTSSGQRESAASTPDPLAHLRVAPVTVSEISARSALTERGDFVQPEMGSTGKMPPIVLAQGETNDAGTKTTGRSGNAPLRSHPSDPSGGVELDLSGTPTADPELLAQIRQAARTSSDRVIELKAGMIPTEAQEQNGSGDQQAQESPRSPFDTQRYKWLAPSSVAGANMRLSGPVIQTSVDGVNRVFFAEDNSVAKVTIAPDVTDAQRRQAVLVAGYAGLIHDDPEALSAASRIQRQTIGFSQQNIEGLATPEQTRQNAVRGATAYVNDVPGNNYANYLRARYGRFTAEDRQYFAQIADPSQPNSIWSSTFIPATDTLVSSGVPITETARAAATNPALLRIPSWQRGAAIKAVVAYLNDLVPPQAGESELARDVVIGRMAPGVTADEVNAALAISLESPPGSKVSADLTKSVAMLASGQGLDGAMQTYRQLRVIQNAISSGNLSETPETTPGSGKTTPDGKTEPPSDPVRDQGSGSKVPPTDVSAGVGVRAADLYVLAARDGGFDPMELENPRVAELVRQIYDTAPQLMDSAAIATRVVGPKLVSLDLVETVNDMLKAGWQANRISRPDILTAQSIRYAMRVSGSGQNLSVSPRSVHDLRMAPEYTPEAASVPAHLLDLARGEPQT